MERWTSSGLWNLVAILVCMPVAAGTCPDVKEPVSTTIGQPWQGERFVYALDRKVATDPAKVDAFESACGDLLASTALKCTPRSSAPHAADYVFVTDGTHDFSHIGRQGGCQLMSIATWSNPIVIAHEIKHALGWAHEQQHPERDRYLDVYPEAIEPAHRAEFEIRDLGNEGPYDADSMMHFYPADFARPGQVAFRLKDGVGGTVVYLGQRDHISETDRAEIRAVYGAESE